MKFWDPEDHVFQFKTAKLYPTIEEFSTIVGYDPSRKSVVASCDPRHGEFLFDARPTSITSRMIEGHMVDLRVILSRLINKRTYGVTDNMQKNFGLALWFVGKFLLCSRRHGFANAQAISVVSQIKDGDKPVSLILAKPLLGLDSVFHGGESQNFLGSPLTLQTWLMERLDMIARPTSCNYGLDSFPSRTVIKSECQTESDWLKFLNKKSSASIRWNCYWRKCPPFLLRSPGSDHIFIVGLRRVTFHKADRLLRQFQYEQGMLGGKGRKPFTPVDILLL